NEHMAIAAGRSANENVPFCIGDGDQIAMLINRETFESGTEPVQPATCIFLQVIQEQITIDTLQEAFLPGRGEHIAAVTAHSDQSASRLITGDDLTRSLRQIPSTHTVITSGVESTFGGEFEVHDR